MSVIHSWFGPSRSNERLTKSVLVPLVVTFSPRSPGSTVYPKLAMSVKSSWRIRKISRVRQFVETLSFRCRRLSGAPEEGLKPDEDSCLLRRITRLGRV